MTGVKRSPSDFPIEALDRELIARGAVAAVEECRKFKINGGAPALDRMMSHTEKLYHPDNIPALNPALSHVTIRQLTQTLILKIREAESDKAIRGHGIRMDMHQVNDPHIKRNARAVASIWTRDNVIDNRNGFSSLRHGWFGKSFNLHHSEPYYRQPVAEGRLCTGFLVDENVIATAGHCADHGNVKTLRFVFGYEMEEVDSPVTQAPNQDIYKGTEIIERGYDPNHSGADWALVKLDRPTAGREAVTLSQTGARRDDLVYVLGHPCGLPLKYVPEEPVTKVDPAFFSAELSVYGGNSGSPVFSGDTHDVVGIAVRGDMQDFRWSGDGWISIRYDGSSSKSVMPQCTNVSEFIQHCR